MKKISILQEYFLGNKAIELIQKGIIVQKLLYFTIVRLFIGVLGSKDLGFLYLEL